MFFFGVGGSIIDIDKSDIIELPFYAIQQFAEACFPQYHGCPKSS